METWSDSLVADEDSLIREKQLPAIVYLLLFASPFTGKVDGEKA